MLRPIDAYTLNNALMSWYNDTEDETEKSILRRVMQMVVHAPTLTPLNEPEYREYTCPYCYHTWLEDRDASDYPNYCPVCRAVLRDGSAPPNEALTMEELQEMDGEPVWVDTIKRWGIVRVCGYGISVLTKSGEYDVTRMKFYRHPPEGEEYT